ncbi:hypothetical protein NDU88_000826 [Pleurodeles waltl]|uniref:Uncharacterized protein n=1 Tax=Pleurodeles waltl TaxID=8319 RepID=A0AAV7S9T0_PLEWA|nr:hypothetical protein NDU88_000826 [Pleurodeles waltl]
MLLRPPATGYSRTPDAPPPDDDNPTWRLLICRVQARSRRPQSAGHSTAKSEHPPQAESAGLNLLQHGLQAGPESVPRCGSACGNWWNQTASVWAADAAADLAAQQVERRSHSGRLIQYAGTAAGAGPTSDRGNRDTVVSTSHGGWREEWTVARSGRHLLVECCAAAGRPHLAPLLRGVVEDSVRHRLYQPG